MLLDTWDSTEPYRIVTPFETLRNARDSSIISTAYCLSVLNQFRYNFSLKGKCENEFLDEQICGQSGIYGATSDVVGPHGGRSLNSSLIEVLSAEKKL